MSLEVSRTNLLVCPCLKATAGRHTFGIHEGDYDVGVTEAKHVFLQEVLGSVEVQPQVLRGG